MGYSCTAAANKVLEAAMAAAVWTGERGAYGNAPSNAWSNAGREYFFDIGREQRDGAITAQIYSQRADGTDYIGSGSLRIEPEGKITRWNGATKAMREAGEAEARIQMAFLKGASFAF